MSIRRYIQWYSSCKILEL